MNIEQEIAKLEALRAKTEMEPVSIHSGRRIDRKVTALRNIQHEIDTLRRRQRNDRRREWETDIALPF